MSTREVAALVDSYKAGEALTAKQFFAMTLSSGNAVGVSSAGGVGIGVGLDKPASGGEVAVGSSGYFPISYGGTMAVFDRITTDAAGEFVKSINDDDYLWGMCVEAGVNGDARSALMHAPFQPMPLRNLDGRGAMGQVRATYDFATDGGAQGTINLPGKLPNNAVVTRAFYFVATPVTSGGAAEIALGINTDDTDGLIAAAILGTNGTAGWHECIQDGTAANFSEACTAERTIDLAITVADLTAGNLVVFCEYVIID